MKYSASTLLPMRRPCMSVKATTTVSISPFLVAAPSCSFVSNVSPDGGALAAACPCHEALEQLRRPGEIRCELLRVALDGDGQAVVGCQAFDCAVLPRRGLAQPRRERSDRLVVKAVDPELGLADGATQLRVRVDFDGVRQMVATEGSDLVALEVLEQSPTHSHIDDLLSAADPEHRDLLLERLIDEPYLCLVQLGVDVPQFGVGLLTIAGRVDIPTAGQEEPVEVPESLGA